jgi:hypothetical protein
LFTKIGDMLMPLFRVKMFITLWENIVSLQKKVL